MTQLQPQRIIFYVLLAAVMAACSGTKVVNEWHAESGKISPAKKLAVVVMLPEQGLRQVMEQVLTDEINRAGVRRNVATS